MDISNGKHKNEVELSEAVEPSFGNKEGQNSTMDESLEMETKNPKNPMLISPVIRCVLKFLNIEDIKNCRLVCHEWGSNGKLQLSSCARIHIRADSSDRRPADFNSCFLNSATLFSAFKISCFSTKERECDPTTIEELNKFFEDQQKFIKELTLKFESSFSSEKVNNFDLSSWISKSPLVQKDAKYMTKLSIDGDDKNLFIIRFHLIAEIKELTLYSCRINFDAGIKICSTKLKLQRMVFYQDGNKLDRIRINDIVDLCKAEEVSLYSRGPKFTLFIVDLVGNGFLKKLHLELCEILNGETSQWTIEHLSLDCIPFSLNREMKIKELCLTQRETFDLSILPHSIQKLSLHVFGDWEGLICTQPNVLQNLQYLNIFYDLGRGTNLSHFMDCPRLTHLKFFGYFETLKSITLPRNVKTLSFDSSVLQLTDGISWNLDKLVLGNDRPTISAMAFIQAGIPVQELIFNNLKTAVNKNLTDFLKYPSLFQYCKRLYIGKVNWEGKQLEESLLKEYVDVKASFYVFEHGEKGRAISEKVFYQLIPNHIGH